MVSVIAAATNPNAQASMAAAMMGYNSPHGSGAFGETHGRAASLDEDYRGDHSANVPSGGSHGVTSGLAEDHGAWDGG